MRKNIKLWQTDAVNSVGQITDYRTGNGLVTQWEYHPQNMRPESIHTAITGQNPVQDIEFQWYSNGNLEHRKKWINRYLNHSLTERFTYDDLNRLENVFLNNIFRGYHDYDLNGLGNITDKATDGKEVLIDAEYGEENYGPHALTSFYTDHIYPEIGQEITYSSFEKVTSITQGTKSLSIQYGFHKQRIEQTVTDQSETKLKRWVGACEYITVNGQQTIHTYLSGPMGVYAIHITHPDESTEINYIHKDHLGSWHTITNQSGALLQELSFDAWGQRRNPETWRFFTGAVPQPLFDRGFTEHEHLYAFDLINMNGRVYDPLVSRFLSPDPYIQAPDYSQSFNRYSYVWNNPLKYTDPSGEFIFTAFLGPVGAIIDAACWGAVIGGAGYTASVAFSDGGFDNWNSGDFWKSVGIGAISGAVTGGIGQMFGPVGSMGIGGEIARAYTHGYAQGLISEFTGGDFMTGFAAGGLSSLAGSSFLMYGGKFANSTLGTYSFSGLAGGVGAELTGGDFFQGAAIGIMNTGLNHLQSMVDEAGARYIANKKAAYDYMWDNSFSDGSPKREVSAWELENGSTIVLPFDKNTLDYSLNNALPLSKMQANGSRYVKFNGKWYEISTHAHTHPAIHPGTGIGLSGIGGDATMYLSLNRNIHVLYNKNLYEAWYIKGSWSWRNLGSW